MIQRVVFCCNYVIAYLLNESSGTSHWEEADIQGPAYLVQRVGTPRYQLIVQSVTSPKQLVHTLHSAWDVDPHENYFFFKTQNPDDNVQGLWLQHDVDRQRLTGAISAALLELKSLAFDCCSEIDDMRNDVNDAFCSGRAARSGSVREFGRLTSDKAFSGADLVAKAANLFAPVTPRKDGLPRLLGREVGRPSKVHQQDAGRSGFVSPFQCKPYRCASIGSTRELSACDHWKLRPSDVKEYDLLGSLLDERSLSMPFAFGQEGL